MCEHLVAGGVNANAILPPLNPCADRVSYPPILHRLNVALNWNTLKAKAEIGLAVGWLLSQIRQQRSWRSVSLHHGECLLLAQTGHFAAESQWPLSGVKRIAQTHCNVC